MKTTSIDNEFFSKLETLSLNLRSRLTGYFGGKHFVRSYGQTTEFADYREYQLGDDIRRIDWNLYSRFEKHFLKLFTDERQMQIQIFLDCSASMGKDNLPKASYAVATAAALGFLSVQSMDKINFCLMKENGVEDPFGTIVGKKVFFGAIGALKKIAFDGEVDIASCVKNCPHTEVKNGLSVIISDFFTDSDWKNAVEYLRYKGRQVLLLQILTPEEEDPSYEGRVNLIDSEAVDISDTKNMKIRIDGSFQKAYEKAIRAMKEDLLDFCKKRDVDYISVRTSEPIEKALFGRLLQTGIMA